jgi:hypothetical protein
MDTDATLTDSENWTPSYESATIPTTSMLSPVLGLLLLASAPQFPLSNRTEQQMLRREVATAIDASLPTYVLEFVDEMGTDTTLAAVVEDELAENSLFDRDDPVNLDSHLALAGLSRAVFPNSRIMTDWEKKLTDDFFLAQFS